jgi:death-on-curing protein
VGQPIWLTSQLVELIHLEQLAEHGGRRGVRDRNALESAVARPRQHWSYDASTTLPELAAALCFGIIRDHPFVDGNKRVGFLAAYTFLALNGLEVETDDDDVVATITGVAAGSFPEAILAKWMAAHARPRAKTD